MSTTSTAIAFGEKLLALLDTGSFTTSYKYATLLGLVDEVLEHTGSRGKAPTFVHGRAVAGRVMELYWSQARPFSASGPLRQSAQNDIPAKLAALRDRLGLPEHMSLFEAKRLHPAELAAARRSIEVTVLRFPVPRLQRLGDGRRAVEDRFIYDYGWNGDVSASELRSARVDDRLFLVGDAGAHLIALAGLIRPIVQREWMAHVARRNPEEVEEVRLERYLFGSERITLTKLERPLRELQGGACFYCGGSRGPWEVDHFLPRSRWNDDSLDNLVVADRRCNNAKRAALPGTAHLQAWWPRLQNDTPAYDVLSEIAERTGWYRRPVAAAGVARALYLRLPAGTGLWTPHEIETVDPARLAVIFGTDNQSLRQVAEEPEGYEPRDNGVDPAT